MTTELLKIFIFVILFVTVCPADKAWPVADAPGIQISPTMQVSWPQNLNIKPVFLPSMKGYLCRAI